MSEFEKAMRALADRHPHMPLVEALELVDGEGRTLAIHLAGVSVREQALWVLEQPDIMALMDRKIHAIKEVRARTMLGLKEAKEAVEMAASLQAKGYLTSEQREQLEREQAEAIASILGDRAHTSRDASRVTGDE